ncbi:hypothetical protein ACFYN3_31040 [Streptomyces lavendulae]|uniref:SMODS domain-containing nucleotidyltransferase n=1 Tax=Streptomyces lavendulae TaxID=1914 RepID=UPI0036951442
MATTTASAFDRFDRIITPAPVVRRKVPGRRDAVAVALAQAFPPGSDIEYRSTRIFGSLTRDTAISTAADVDLLTHLRVAPDVWDSHYRTDSAAFLQRVHRALEVAFSVARKAHPQRVRLLFPDGLNVDVAAVVRYDTGEYRIPDGFGHWRITDPDADDAHLDRCRAALDGDLRRIVRLAKQWKLVHDVRLRSFHLEMLMSRTFSVLTDDAGRALELFFCYNHGNLSVRAAGGHEDLAHYLTRQERLAIDAHMDEAWKCAVSANEAERRGDHPEAIRLWRGVLGDGFPHQASPDGQTSGISRRAHS